MRRLPGSGWVMWLIAAGVVLVVAGFLRFHRLDVRPMHTDEAVQAAKLGELLETGRYRFDPVDHHGPTLYYLAVPVVRVMGIRDYASLGEAAVRTLPALAGFATVAVLLAFAPLVGRGIALAAAGLMAVATPAVYYSRYFVQESLLVLFSTIFLGFAWRAWRGGGTGCWVGMGLAVGLMAATKATTPIFLAAAVGAFWVAGWRPSFDPTSRRRVWIAVAAALPVFIVFYSSFFTHPRGLIDAFCTYFQSADRAAGGGHAKGVFYYVSLLAWHADGGYRWSEVLLLGSGVTGMAMALVSRNAGAVGRIPAVLAILTLAAYSLIPYKTPWLILNAVPALALSGGVAWSWVIRRIPGIAAAFVVVLFLAALTWQGRQAARAAWVRPADARNPWAYVHTSVDILRLPGILDEILAEISDGREPVIKVVGPEYWPIPWYLRRYEQTGYWQEAPPDLSADVLIASPQVWRSLLDRVPELDYPQVIGLRPGVLLWVGSARDGADLRR